ncbi:MULTISPECIES: hypothetical protein [unclassified Acinetobacter]|uniref:hypothetical protein n=1 Tax=unclassified Acinetobacter TaxID=196816 RepID=UPI00244B84CE|nr:MULTISPECIES: hypothetical protein [unclassified Acinetobacter]MDH0032920.1 hypothetical protein [Acinetobacter sp. GD04021]MDH0887315.1 hypothetical protein [Acinetobacter sp. GD03873]MDH1084711.1 hypothetical protein [Acinetobacter sp. GD03983]MDH2190631.1 hypothetical protein [Acinetobacter sp. GD03645]MDH2205075.1 hypothetical protein [Acinetobacter sp. GD03647]
MLNFDPIPIGEKSYQLNEVIFNDALKVAAVPAKFNEKRISAFLAHSLKDSLLPLKMTAQERIFLMLKYVQQQTNTLFSSDADLSKCFLEQGVWLDQITERGVTVRQLNGTEAEYLEAHCMNAAEWIACMLAFQISYENHEHLGSFPDRGLPDLAYKDQFSLRLNYLKSLPQSDFDLVYQDFQKLNNQLFTHVQLSVNNDGLVVLRGADDAPLRFRAASAFIGIIKELDKSFT